MRAEEVAQFLLDCCLRGENWPREALPHLLDDESLLKVVAEGLADRFDPALCDTYAGLFAEAIARILPELDPAELLARYQRVRKPRKFAGKPRKVFVLSRVTLGADVAVTSLILDAAKRRFPDAQVILFGRRKNWELFAADRALTLLPVFFPRGILRHRLHSWSWMRSALSEPHSIVIDPDSRLTQLGLLPVCPEENYYFFESRAYGADTDDPLPVLTRRWIAETFDIHDAQPYVCPGRPPVIEKRPLITVSLGVGENPRKRIPDPFEQELLANLARRDALVWIDRGAGGEEAERVNHAIQGLAASTWEHSFGGFASLIAASNLYIGYDSAGQHVAAASAVPMVSVFAGFPVPRMFHRWRPSGRGPIRVVRVENPDPEEVLVQTIKAVNNIAL